MPYPKSKLNQLRDLFESFLVEGADPEVEPKVPVYAGSRYLSDSGDSPKVVLTYSNTEFELPTDNDQTIFNRVDLIWVYVFGRDVLKGEEDEKDATATDETEALTTRIIQNLDALGYFQVDGNRLIDDGAWVTQESDTTDSWDNRGDTYRFSMRVSDKIERLTNTTQIDCVTIETELGESAGNTINEPPPSPPFAI